MMVDDCIALAHRWTEELWNQGREQVIDELLAPDVVIHGFGGPGEGPIHGREAFREGYRAFRSAFSDIHLKIEEAAADGDVVSTRFTGTATHTGEHVGVAATGRPVCFTGMVWARVREGQVAECWNSVDFLPMLLEIGALRLAGEAEREEERIRGLAHRWFEEVWNQGRTETIHELLSAEMIAHGLGPTALLGPAAFVEFQQQFLGAFPDFRVTVEDIVVEGSRAAVRITCRGTHQGDHLGFPATGRPVLFTGMTLTRWEDGKLVEGRNVIDFATMHRQLAGPR